MPKTHATRDWRSRHIEPFLRWAGGKRHIIEELLECLPNDMGRRMYREPFFGAGSLFFALQPERAILSDANEHLINCYKHVRDAPELIFSYLRKHAAKSSKCYYYQVRYKYNNAPFSIAQAARFIYLNSTCFNGIFRVNQKGKFNVPYGWKDPPKLPSLDHLKRASAALKPSNLFAASFEVAIDSAPRTDFFYLDPPYPPLNGTSFFTHYTTDRFSNENQQKLAELVMKINARGAKFLITNADTPLIRRLYKPFNFKKISVTRYITCKAKKHQVSELIITNY